jgi:O-antigen ligase/predicted Zn-dependent protease
LAGALAVSVGLVRLVFGLGKYYRVESGLATLLLLWMGACSYFTLDLHASQRSLAGFTGGVAFLLLCQASIETRKQWRGVVYTLIGVCFLASIVAWIVGLMQARESGVLPPLRGTFANHDTFSVLPLLAVCLIMGLIEKSGPKLTWVNMGLASFFVLTLYGTGCRAALVGFVVAALVFGLSLQFLRKDKSEKTRLFVGFPLAVGILITPFVGYQYASEAKWGQVTDGTAVEYQSLRMELLEYGWKAVAANPIFGAGPGAFGQAYQTVRPTEHEDLFVNIAHNDFLEFAVECGLPGLLLWCALTWFAISIPWKNLREGRRPTEAAGVMAAVIALAVFSVFNFIVVQRPVLWAQMWVFGLALSFPSNRERWEEAPLVRVVAGLLLVGFGLWTAKWGYHSFKAENLYFVGQQAEKKLELEEAAGFYAQAAAEEVPRYDRVLQRVALLEKLRVFNGDDNLAEQLSILEEAREANPKRIPILLRLAEAQQSAGELEGARATLDTAWAASPFNRHVFSSRVDFLISQAELKAAAEALSQVTYHQSEDNDTKFVNVLYVLFQNEPDSAARFLGDWLKAHPDEKGAALADQVATKARSKKEWTAELAVLDVWKTSQPENTCLEERYARALGDSRGADQEYSYLTKLLGKPLNNSDTCYSNLLKRWAELGVQLGHGAEAEKAVGEFLEILPNRHWARAFLAQQKADRGQFTEAVSLLREGLNKAPNDPVLLLSLGGVFEQQGSLELAVNYYREVARRHPENQEAASRLKETLKKL